MNFILVCKGTGDKPRVGTFWGHKRAQAKDQIIEIQPARAWTKQTGIWRMAHSFAPAWKHV